MNSIRLKRYTLVCFHLFPWIRDWNAHVDVALMRFRTSLTVSIFGNRSLLRTMPLARIGTSLTLHIGDHCSQCELERETFGPWQACACLCRVCGNARHSNLFVACPRMARTAPMPLTIAKRARHLLIHSIYALVSSGCGRGDASSHDVEVKRRRMHEVVGAS